MQIQAFSFFHLNLTSDHKAHSLLPKSFTFVPSSHASQSLVELTSPVKHCAHLSCTLVPTECSRLKMHPHLMSVETPTTQTLSQMPLYPENSLTSSLAEIAGAVGKTDISFVPRKSLQLNYIHQLFRKASPFPSALQCVKETEHVTSGLVNLKL